MRKAALLAIGVLAIVTAPTLLAQSSPFSEFEDYESWSLGTIPGDTTFADHTAYQGCSGPCVVSTSTTRFFIESPGFDGTDQRYQVFDPNTGGYKARYDFFDASTAGWDYTSFYVDAAADGGAQILFCGNDGFNTFHGDCGSGSAAGYIFQMDMNDAASGGWRVQDGNFFCTVPDLDLDHDNEGGSKFIEIFFDFAAKDADWYVDGVLKGTMAFCDTSVSYWSDMVLFPRNLASGDGRIFFDQWEVLDFSDVVEPVVVEEPPSPEEFSQAVQDMLNRRGWVSSESQVLFSFAVASIVTVLMALVTVFMQSGVLKNIIILLPGDLILFASAFILNVPDWMIVVSLALGTIAILGGPKEARNTYHEVLRNLREGTAIATDFVRANRRSFNPFRRGEPRPTDLDPFIRDESSDRVRVPRDDGELTIDRTDRTPDEPSASSVEAVRESVDLLKRDDGDT